MSAYLFLGFIIGAASISFGFWRHDFYAGIWMFMLLFATIFIIDYLGGRG